MHSFSATAPTYPVDFPKPHDLHAVLAAMGLYAVVGQSSHGRVLGPEENSPGLQGRQLPSFDMPCPGKQNMLGASIISEVIWSLAATRTPEVLKIPPMSLVKNSPAGNESLIEPARNMKFDVVQTMVKEVATLLSMRHAT